jgi:hypothetical protein
MDRICRKDFLSKRFDQWCKELCALPGPAGHGAARKIDALTPVDLGLAIEGQMVAVFLHQEMRKQPRTSFALINRIAGRVTLHDLVAMDASTARADGADHAEGSRDIFEDFEDIVANGTKQRALAGRALGGRRDHDIGFDYLVGSLGAVLLRRLSTNGSWISG